LYCVKTQLERKLWSGFYTSNGKCKLAKFTSSHDPTNQATSPSLNLENLEILLASLNLTNEMSNDRLSFTAYPLLLTKEIK
jgi:hypothetical protein